MPQTHSEAPADAEGLGPGVRYRGVTVLIVGATGFIGRWVTRCLASAGARVRIVARDQAAAERVQQTFGISDGPIIADVSRAGAFAGVYSSVQPALTVNAAGYGVDRAERDETATVRINADLVEEMARTIADRLPADDGWEGQRFVHIGSAFEYGSVENEVSEQIDPRPETSYGKSKLEGTRRLHAVADADGLRAVTARVATVYGPGEHPHRLLPSLIRAGQTGESLDLTAGEQLRDFTYVADVAEGLLRLGALPDVPDHVVNLATGSLQTVREFIGCAREVIGLRPEQVRLGALPYRENEVWQGRLDVSKLEGLLGWKPATGMRAGIEHTVAASRGGP